MIEQLQKLYARDITGKLRLWYIELNDHFQYRTVSGLIDGQLVTSAWTDVLVKNVGRSNETSLEQQARLEIAALYKKKTDRKYYSDPDNIGGAKFFECMTAKKYIKQSGPFLVQPKLDGIRMIASKDGMISRKGKPFNNLPHIWDAIKHIFEAYPDTILDGELYNHELKGDFEELSSYIRRSKRDEKHEQLCRELVQYHVYDVPSEPGSFATRLEELSLLAFMYFDGKVVQRVPTRYVHNVDQIEDSLQTNLAEGYEGIMLRKPDGLYEGGEQRSVNLLKYKLFDDAEFEILDIQEGKGNWSGYAKRIVLRLEDGTTCDAGVRGSKPFCKDLLENWRTHGYKYVTVRFFGRTSDNKLRFPVCLKKYYKTLEDKE